MSALKFVMIVYIQGCGRSFGINVVGTSRTDHISAIAKYYLPCVCDIALVYQGRRLRDGIELRHYGVQDESTFWVELRYQRSSVHDEAHDAFYGSMCQQAFYALHNEM
jgi:hypothetical protein